MKDLEKGLPIIIDDKFKFKCPLNVVHGTIELVVYDNKTDEFPAVVKADTNMGSGSISISLKGNETIKKSISGINAEVQISKWQCNNEELSFHIKAQAKKGFIKCTICDRTFKGDRHNEAIFAEQMSDILKKVETAQV